MSILAVSGLAKEFVPGQRVVDGVSFRLNAGERIALVGPNGCGKSTLLKCILGLTPFNEGSISWSSGSQTQAGESYQPYKSHGIGTVFQKHNLVPRISVLSNVIQGATGRVSGMQAWFQWSAPQALRDEAMAQLEKVGLGEKALQRADTLSGGQSQRAAIARALMRRPEVLFADEPAASLDPKNGLRVMRLLCQEAENAEIPLLFVTHSLEHAFSFSTRILAMRAGKIEIDSRPEDLDSKKLDAIYRFEEPSKVEGAVL